MPLHQLFVSTKDCYRVVIPFRVAIDLRDNTFTVDVFESLQLEPGIRFYFSVVVFDSLDNGFSEWVLT